MYAGNQGQPGLPVPDDVSLNDESQHLLRTAYVSGTALKFYLDKLFIATLSGFLS